MTQPHTHARMHTCRYVHTRANIEMQSHTCKHAHTHTRIHTHTNTNILALPSGYILSSCCAECGSVFYLSSLIHFPQYLYEKIIIYLELNFVLINQPSSLC